MTQVLEKPPTQINSTERRSYLLALSNTLTLYWDGKYWSALKETAHVFPFYEAADQKRPRTTQQAPVVSSVAIFEK